MYIRLIAEAKEKAGADIWSYCLMPNHVHFVVVPERTASLRALFGNVHREYARRINKRERWQGHLWQERFHSFVMDEKYLLATVRYTELNPVRAGLCTSAGKWPWSSARAHLEGVNDDLVSVEPMLRRVTTWSRYLEEPACESTLDEIRKHAWTGRPIGSDAFMDEMENSVGRCLRKAKPGRKPRNK